MLCYAMLCYAMLCYAMLCYAMLCYAMLCYVMICNFVDLARKTLHLSITSSIASCQNKWSEDGKLQTVPIFPKETIETFYFMCRLHKYISKLKRFLWQKKRTPVCFL